MPIYLSLRVDVVSVKSVSGMLENLHKLGIEPVRRVNSRGTFNPHLSIHFDEHTFNIDSTRSTRRDIDDGCYLITHAHSDHYGKSAMLSKRAYASEKTARALEVRYGKKFMGTTFALGDTVDIDGVSVDTYHTYHTIGSTAFSWISDNGGRVLVTGDVKNAKDLPKCDVLVTEANYGDPEDPACHFEDDVEGFNNALEHNVAFGAYAFGKAQRAVGQEVVVLPGSQKTTIEAIDFAGESLEYAFPPQSVTLRLTDEIDVSRGSMIVDAINQPQQSQEINLMVCWLSEKPLVLRGKYQLKHNSNELRCIVTEVKYKVNINTTEEIHDDLSVGLNEIAQITIKTTKPLFFDPYKKNRDTGSLILIDEATNNVVGAGMIL